jgi:TPR repeat protein
MGYKDTWLLIPQADTATVLARMQLRAARPGEGPPVARALRLPAAAGGAWTLLAFDHYADATEPFRNEAAQAAWSRGTELLGLEINENINFSQAFGVRDGGSRWSLMHMLDEGQEHLEVKGEPPEGWRTLHAAELARLRADEGGDLMFSVPIDTLALRVGATPYTLDTEVGCEGVTPLVRELPQLDDATQQLLLGTAGAEALAPERLRASLQAAARGDAVARYNVGVALLRCKPPTAAHGQLAQQWLERAANQGEGTAQAVLGTCMCNGRPGFERDGRQGLQWLELSAAQDHREGLRRLADHLYETSIHRRGDSVMAVDDAASTARLTRMLALLERGVEVGSQGCLVDLANRVYEGIGAPADLVAAKAIVKIARVKGNVHLPENTPEYDALFVPTPEEAPIVEQLARDWASIGAALVSGLRARRAAQQAKLNAMKAELSAARQTAQWARAKLAHVQAQQGAQRAQAEESALRDALGALVQTDDGRPVGSLRWAPGCTALVLGIGLLVLALALASSSSQAFTRLLLLTAGLCGAWGGWRLGTVRGWGVPARAAVAALMLVPGVGLVLSVWLILKQVQRD